MYMKLCFDTLLKLSFPMTSQITIFLILLALLHPRGIGGGGGGGGGGGVGGETERVTRKLQYHMIYARET